MAVLSAGPPPPVCRWGILTQTHGKNNTTNDHTKNHLPHLTTIECGAATVRTTSHTRVGGRAEVSVGGREAVNIAMDGFFFCDKLLFAMHIFLFPLLLMYLYLYATCRSF